MSLYYPLMVLSNNDTNFYLSVTFNQAPMDLTNFTLKAYQKASATAPDSGATVYTVGAGLTVTNAKLGKVTLAIPHANVPEGSATQTEWWRLDLIDGFNNVLTAFYGPLTIKAA